jgi:hypothetical protein
VGAFCDTRKKELDVIDRKKWKLKGLRAGLVLAAAAVLSPVAAHAAQSSSFSVYISKVLALGSADGYVYNPVDIALDHLGNPSGVAGQGLLPGQSVRLSQITSATGNGVGAGCWGGAAHIFGLGANDGRAYLVEYMNGSCQWTPGGLLAGPAVAYSQLDTLIGYNRNRVRNYLQVIGFGTDGQIYLAAYQDDGGTWNAGWQLASAGAPFSSIKVGYGNGGRIQVIGTSAATGRLYIAAYQENNGSWHSGFALPNTATGYSNLALGNGNDGYLQVIGISNSDSYWYLLDYLDSSGNWHNGIPVTRPAIPMTRAIINYASRTPDEVLQVGGIRSPDHILTYTNWLDITGAWHLVSNYTVLQVPVATARNTHIANSSHSYSYNVGLSESDNHWYVLNFQGDDDTWYNGVDLTAQSGTGSAAGAPWLGGP